MSDLSKKYEEILKDLDKNIKDEKDLKYVKEKVGEISILFIDIIDRMTYLLDDKMDDVTRKVNKIQKIVDGIENDIYDDNFEFEVTCPYCNNEFTADIESDSKKDIICPECNNVIELDWNDEEQEHACSGNCASCHGDCSDESFEEYDNEYNEEMEEED